MPAHWKIAIVGAVLTTGSIVACGSEQPLSEAEAGGEAEVALTNVPSDAKCLRLTVQGTRTDVRTLSLAGKAVFRLSGLPVGDDTFSAEAFPVACSALNNAITPTWVSEPVTERIVAGKVTHVAIAMIHNGAVSVGVDFDEGRGPHQDPEAGECSGFVTSAPAYIVPVAPGVITVPILTVGESVNNKPDGTPYRMVGLPDGLGALDNGDGTFTLLSNHEVGATAGIARAHGGKGAFVSKWTMCKDTFGVQHGEDLIQKVYLWDVASASYVLATNPVFGRFCSADLPEPSALFDAETGLGFDGALFFNGEETGSEGRGFAHALDGTSWELPRTGKFSWENSVPNPGSGKLTVVVGLDDTTPGEVYFYYGTKTNTGTPVEKAGLTNGNLYALRVVGIPTEPAAGIPSAPFDLVNHGNVEAWTGVQLQAADNAAGVTKWNRPEDGAWDPNNSDDFYFVTTSSFSTPSRLWRASFVDVTRPELGGQVEMLLDGTEGQRMFDNMTLDQYGHVYLQEDPGGQDHIAKVWRYDIASDVLTLLAQHNLDLFTPGSPNFITNDEESSGIMDAADILGPGWFLLNSQAHKNISATEPELVEPGQFLALYDPKSAE